MTDDLLSDRALAARLNRSPGQIPTREQLELLVKTRQFQHLDDLTLCILRTYDGMPVIGHYTPFDGQTLDRDVGERLAYDHALAQLERLDSFFRRKRRPQDAAALEIDKTLKGAWDAAKPTMQPADYQTEV